MELTEVIDKQLERIQKMFENEGNWTGEDYMKMIAPLHEAILELAKGKNATTNI